MSARRGSARGLTFFICAIGPMRRVPPPKVSGYVARGNSCFGCGSVGVASLGRTMSSDVCILCM